MKKTGTLVLMLMLFAACNDASAGFQPRVFLPEASIHAEDDYVPDTAVPVKKVFIKQTQLEPTQVKQLHTNPALVTRPVQNTNVMPVAPVKRDTALMRILYEGFKPKIKTSPDKIKIKHIIDSLVTVKDNPPGSGGTPALTYQDMVRILDSLIKANNIETRPVKDSPVANVPDTTKTIMTDTPAQAPENFFKKYGKLAGLIVIGLAAIVFVMMRRKRPAAADNRIFFSYAWEQDEAFVLQLYNSLKRDGFTVVKDKENMGYKGVISQFMNEIGSANYVVVAISDKYLRSRFCMYELYELYKNSGMNAEKFGKKLFPVRIDETLNLSDPDTVNSYVRYWQEQEDSWEKRMKEDTGSITEEQARQYQFIKRLVTDVQNILSCLADINALNQRTLQANDFADIKMALRRSMEGS